MEGPILCPSAVGTVCVPRTVLRGATSGCAADGQIYKQALANVEIIIQEWIETAEELDRPIPAPRGRLAFVQQALQAPPRSVHRENVPSVHRPLVLPAYDSSLARGTMRHFYEGTRGLHRLG